MCVSTIESLSLFRKTMKKHGKLQVKSWFGVLFSDFRFLCLFLLSIRETILGTPPFPPGPSAGGLPTRERERERQRDRDRKRQREREHKVCIYLATHMHCTRVYLYMYIYIYMYMYMHVSYYVDASIYEPANG